MDKLNLLQQIRQKFHIVPTALHLTSIQNLNTICKDNGIYSRDKMSCKSFKDISNLSVQEGRSDKIIPETGRKLHEYVPLFFSFKAPMVASLQNINEELIYLQINLDIFTRIPKIIISNGNARSNSTTFCVFDSIDDLSILDFSIVQKTVGYAKDKEKARKKAAELLVPDFLPLEEVKCIIFYNNAGKQQALEILKKFDRKISYIVRPDWFFESNEKRR